MQPVSHHHLNHHYFTTMDEETGIKLKKFEGEVCSVKADLVKRIRETSRNSRKKGNVPRQRGMMFINCDERTNVFARRRKVWRRR